MLKKGLFILCCLIFFVAIAKAIDKKMLSVSIKGVPCSYCVNKLVSSVKKIHGVESVRISMDYTELLIIMLANENPDIAQINKTIVDSGYSALGTKELTTQTKDTKTNLSANHLQIKNQPCANCHKG